MTAARVESGLWRRRRDSEAFKLRDDLAVRWKGAAVATSLHVAQGEMIDVGLGDECFAGQICGLASTTHGLTELFWILGPDVVPAGA